MWGRSIVEAGAYMRARTVFELLSVVQRAVGAGRRVLVRYRCRNLAGRMYARPSTHGETVIDEKGIVRG